MSAAEALGQEVLVSLGHAPPLDDIKCDFEQLAGASDAVSWIGAEIEGTKLHVTLVPPKVGYLGSHI